jgi:hypothetical protein
MTPYDKEKDRNGLPQVYDNPKARGTVVVRTSHFKCLVLEPIVIGQLRDACDDYLGEKMPKPLEAAADLVAANKLRIEELERLVADYRELAAAWDREDVVGVRVQKDLLEQQGEEFEDGSELTDEEEDGL